MKPLAALRTLTCLALTGSVCSFTSLPTLAQGEEAIHLEEVLVTARKREENLQRTPLSITALTAATI